LIYFYNYDKKFLNMNVKIHKEPFACHSDEATYSGFKVKKKKDSLKRKETFHDHCR
jgi:hypothetical protein